LAGYLNQGEIDAILKDMKKKVNKVNPPGESLPFHEGEKEKSPVVEKVEFAPFKSRCVDSVAKKPGLDFFGNICLVVSGELGSAEITVRDLLKLEEGSVIKLDKIAGESAAILLNGQFLGHAEVVVINDRFGLRITAIGTGETETLKED
jgi:flagellar motor switch protein FliN/FliY